MTIVKVFIELSATFKNLIVIRKLLQYYIKPFMQLTAKLAVNGYLKSGSLLGIWNLDRVGIQNPVQNLVGFGILYRILGSCRTLFATYDVFARRNCYEKAVKHNKHLV